MSAAFVRIIHAPASPGAGRYERLVADVRACLAEIHRRRFLAAHAADAQIITDPAARGGAAEPGTLTLESASLPLAVAADYERLLAAAGTGRAPEPPEEDPWRLAVRLDSPLDLILAAGDVRLPRSLRALADALVADPGLVSFRTARANVVGVLGDRRAQVIVLGRHQPAAPPWPAGSVRSLVLWEPNPRNAMDLERPDALASALAPQADAAIVDTRLLIALRLRRKRLTWPSSEDRFAADLLVPETIADLWLRDLAFSAATGGMPILLGGPSLINWGVRTLLGGRRATAHRP